jgi:hypothetical protein
MKWKHPIEVNCEGISNENGDFRAVKASLSSISSDMMNGSDLGNLEVLAILWTDSNAAIIQ